MSLAARLHRLEQRYGGDGKPCPHQPPRVLYPDGCESVYERERRKREAASEYLPPCWCGHHRLTVRIVYYNQHDGPAPVQ